MSVPTDDHKALALEHLRLAQDALESARAKRIYFASLARKYGASNAEIGRIYGVSEAAVRGLLKRAGATE